MPWHCCIPIAGIGVSVELALNFSSAAVGPASRPRIKTRLAIVAGVGGFGQEPEEEQRLDLQFGLPILCALLQFVCPLANYKPFYVEADSPATRIQEVVSPNDEAMLALQSVWSFT